MNRDESFVSVKEPQAPPEPDSDDEDSFVVLETSSLDGNASQFPSRESVLPPIRTNKVNELQGIVKQKIAQLTPEPMPELPAAVDALDAVAPKSKVIISPDSSYEEIQKQVEDVIKENETLKNIITQNNMSMKTQYERFLGYKDEVTNVMKAYKDKLNEAKGCIDKLKEENAKFAGELEVYIKIKKLQEEEIIKFKEQEISQCVEAKSGFLDPELQIALDESNNKNKELLAEIEKLKQEATKVPKLEYDLEKLTGKLVTTPKLEEELQDHQKKMISLEKEISTLQYQEVKLTAELQEAHKKHEIELKAEQQKIQNLESEISTLKRHEIELTTERKNRETSQSEKLTETSNMVSKFEQRLKSKDDQILTLTQRLQNVSFSECELSTRVKNLESSLLELRQKYNPQLEENYSTLAAQLSTAQRTITALEHERENQIGDIEDLRKLLQEAASQKDEMFALKEQLDVYKNDFEAERTSKTEIKREKDQIAEDLQNLQRRNKQMQNEIDTLRARDKPNPEGYACPKCSFGFNSYQALENHVHRCLDLGELP